jgi:cytochrome b
VQTVWPPLLRLLHWVLALTMIGAFVTHESSGQWRGLTVHEWLGYAALGAAALRVLLGFTGRDPWRFKSFVRSVPFTLAYARDVLAHREGRYLGHNPLGAWMVLALLVNAWVCAVTGWLYTTDRFWGVAWVGNLHDITGHLLIPLLVLHVAGVVFTSVRHRENLVASMLHGRKPSSPAALDRP